ncbi:MAG: hypothetical protein WBP45_08380 [Daejeonella sp.]
MFKRIAVLSFLLVYLSTSAGFAINLHFCGKRLAKVQINSSKQSACCKNKATSKPYKCCKDQNINIKISDEQQVIAKSEAPSVKNLQLFILPYKNPLINYTTGFAQAFTLYWGPPVPADIPLIIKNCVFRI